MIDEINQMIYNVDKLKIRKEKTNEKINIIVIIVLLLTACQSPQKEFTELQQLNYDYSKLFYSTNEIVDSKDNAYPMVMEHYSKEETKKNIKKLHEYYDKIVEISSSMEIDNEEKEQALISKKAMEEELLELDGILKYLKLYNENKAKTINDLSDEERLNFVLLKHKISISRNTCKQLIEEFDRAIGK